MRYLTIFKGAEGVPPSAEMMTEMGKLIEEMTDAGVLISTEGCLPTAHGARVRRSKGKITVIDGPFTEAKEVIGGFALIQVKSKAEAIQWTKRFLEVAGDGESEVRQIAELDDFGAALPQEIREREERTRAKLAKH
jgi:hypothetical protein